MMHHDPFRISPQGQPNAYKTYSYLAPLVTHWRPAACDEVDCEVSALGWTTTVDEATDLGQRQAAYIRTQSGRHPQESRGHGHDGPLTVFTFLPGEECFTAHQIRSDREAIYAVRPGDYRAYGVPFLHDTAEFWIEDYAGHLDKIDKQANG